METKRILIVDESSEVRNRLSRLLRRNGMEVSTAVDGKRALHRLRNGEPFDCVIAEILAPDFPGREFVQRLHDEDVLPLSRVIILTHIHNIDNANAYLQYGCAAYCGKPFDNERLLHQIWKVCGLASDNGDFGALI
jgi:two-component system chemotaxis response regulator CheY